MEMCIVKHHTPGKMYRVDWTRPTQLEVHVKIFILTKYKSCIYYNMQMQNLSPWLKMYTEIQAKNCPLSRSRNKKQDPRQQHNTPIKQYNFRNISINSVQDAYMYLYIYHRFKADFPTLRSNLMQAFSVITSQPNF